ncbi:roadblock/LC7 domain-containing protein [Herpetosiphon giganteus]|uniref:roadblock/LC7 domain-containing protein n=1 Tax=Herpetosiphon giganteus TaxID=2029754 RepID=UPI00195DE209|nr:roadblock/LC7 domain-containing protein [Herpetosiphon giganteus]MBM7842651.1 putative regulator of Ras-like GTPase activity (Roadblock/LC7/MglB family)/signal recognition particle receptor subunit beta [Herpetosiphon giganteus]
MTTQRILVVGAEAEPKTRFIQSICDTWSSHELDGANIQSSQSSVLMDIGHLDYAEQPSVWYGIPASASPIIHELAQTVNGCLVLIDPSADNEAMLELADQLQQSVAGPIMLLVTQQAAVSDHLRTALNRSNHYIVDSYNMHKSESIHRIMTALGGTLPTNSSVQKEYITATFDQVSKVQALFEQLALNTNHDIIGTALIDTNGELLVSTLPAKISPEQLAAISGPWLRIADKVAHSAALGQTEESIIRTAEGLCIIRPVHSHILITLLQPHANLGLFWLNVADMERPLTELLAA